MPAESLFPPISKEAIRAARSRLALAGLSVTDWAEQNGFSPKTVYNVLSGSRPAVRGLALQIALRLGLRPAPDSPPPGNLEGLPGSSELPAGRTEAAPSLPGPETASLAGRAPVHDVNRRPVSQLGEPVR